MEATRHTEEQQSGQSMTGITIQENVDIDNLPYSVHKKLLTTVKKKISFTGMEGTTILQSKNNVELQEKNRIDKARADQSLSIQKNYCLALSDSVDEKKPFLKKTSILSCLVP